jgi:plastocyanin
VIVKSLKGALFVFAGLLFLTGAFLVACGGDDDTNTPPTIAAGGSGGTGPATLNMADNSYSPNTLTATVGQAFTVNLINGGAQPHTFTIDNVTDSGQIAGGARGSVTFTRASAGTLTFYCTVHGRATMSGTLTVR